MKEILRRLKASVVLAIAPEGTRSKTEVLQERKHVAAYLASKVGIPIIPVAITGTEDRVIKDNINHFKRSKIEVRIGSPFKLPPIDRKDRETSLCETTEEIMSQIASILPQRNRGVYTNYPRVKELLN